MSLLGSPNARGAMRHRATIQRNTAGGIDAYRNPVKPTWTDDAAATPCFAWTSARRESQDGEKVAVLEDLRAIFPASADVTERVRVKEIRDRAGAVVFAGPFGIVGKPIEAGHVEVLLVRVTG